MSAETTAKMPAGVGNAYVFQVFNTISFAIVIGTPMILFFKHLQVSATVLGIVVALPPLLNILQIPAAQFVERVGYRAFMLRGWTARTCLIVFMAVVALLPGKIDRTTRIALMLLLLFVYNASRGISSCGYLPWITQLIPESIRGRYLSRDQLSMSLALLGTMTLTGWFVSRVQGEAAYAAMLLASFVAGMVSLLFLRRVPDAPVPASAASTGLVPWKQMISYVPFLRLLVFNIVIHVALAGGVFWVPLVRDRHGFEDWQVLAMMALWSAIASVTLWVFGAVVDRVGSKPLLGVSGIILVVHFTFWAALAAEVVPASLWVMFLIQLTSGIAIALYNFANIRLAMATVPEMGRSHFFAMFSVVINLTLGLLPVAWGLVVDSLAGWQTNWGVWQWNQYSVLYVALTVLIAVGQLFRYRLVEPRAMSTDTFLHEWLVKTPSRAITRLISRRPFS